MPKYNINIVLIIIILILFLSPSLVFSSSLEDYLIEMGKAYLKKGYTQNAEEEFQKALQLNPSNQEAQNYLESIRRRKIKNTLDLMAPREVVSIQSSPIGEDIYYIEPEFPDEKPAKVSPGESKPKEEAQGSGGFTLKGEYQASMGVSEEGELYWKRANADLNEKNWRLFSDTEFNHRENTYDPAIFSRIKFQIDRPVEQGWGFHSNVDISPWSFIGKSEKITVTSAFGDTADVQLKTWSNTGYSINETIYTNLLGNSFGIPEQKVVDGTIPAFTALGAFTPSDTFNIPELDIDYEVWPMREFWFDYTGDGSMFRVFPVASEGIAYTSDDPLSLTNHHTYWEESQWLVNWEPGHLNSGVAPVDFVKGRWDDTMAYFTRDSGGTRLTALRGFSVDLDTDRTSLDFMVASPKELWQEYESFETFNSALRGKYFYLDNMTLGFTYGSKFGYADNNLDATSNTIGLDTNIGITDNTEVFIETATSYAEYDRDSQGYGTEKRGNAFQVNLINASSDVFGKDYFALNPDPKENPPFYKLRLTLTHMDEGFESALASYRETRDDSFWSRHVSFREPFDYFYSGFYGPALSWDDIRPFAIGDGIDYGRDVINFRLETLNFFDDRLDTLVDIRNVHDVNGEFIENVSRLELTYQATDKLETKFLGIRHDLPKTDAGLDPYIIDAQTGDFFVNDVIEADKDPTLKTLSLGAKYDFFDWINLSFVWEHTNDIALGYDNFPRGLYNGSNLGRLFNEEGNTYREALPFLYNQGFFPQVPYPYFDVFKVGMGVRPTDKLQFYLDYTRNEYEWAQIIDDNMNHVGIEASYLPTDRLGLYVRYVYSKVNDISELAEDSRVENRSHHSVFSEVRLRVQEDSELVAQYGVGNTNSIATTTYTPFGGGVATLDTQHIARLYYRKSF